MLAILERHAVDYIVVGGLAVMAHGHTRLTRDLDILPAPDLANLSRLAAALAELEAAAVNPEGAPLELNLSRPEGLAVGSCFLVTKHGALDLVNGPRADLKRYRRLEAAAVTAAVAGHEIKIVSKADLIAMKREAGRPKDLSDIAALTEVERSS
jgi:hypothetical protein